MNKNELTADKNFVIERVFSGERRVRDIVEENILSSKSIHSSLTSDAPQIYNKDIGM